MIGQTVGNYRVTGLLGQGGMGVVYLAEHPGIGRRAAIKVLHGELARDPDVLARFFNEARAANAIRHPGIVEIFDFGTLADGSSYIAMELLEGESLAARLQRAGALPIEAAVELASQAAEALGAAHAQGIVHRDLKPDNLFLTPDRRTPGRELVKVLDFGIAKLGGAGHDAGSLRTRTGAILGTPIYMSPEQCRGTREIDHGTDIYALGVILHEMVCGAPPFVSEGFGELAHLHISAPPPPARSLVAAVPEALERVILRALAKEPGQRFLSMGELRAALGAVRTGGGGDTVKLPPRATALAGATVALGGPAARPPNPTYGTTLSSTAASLEAGDLVQRKRRRWLAPALGIVVVAASAAGLLLVRGRSGPNPGGTATGSNSTAASAAPTAAPAAEPVADRGAAPAARITIEIATRPAGAEVRDPDGAVLGVTPFREVRPQGEGTIKLRLEKEGHRPEVVVVPLDRGLTLSLTLKKDPAGARDDGPASRRRKPREPGQPRPKPSAPEPVEL
jgi:serine/threonine-protein kinase